MRLRDHVDNIEYRFRGRFVSLKHTNAIKYTLARSTVQYLPIAAHLTSRTTPPVPTRAPTSVTPGAQVVPASFSSSRRCALRPHPTPRPTPTPARTPTPSGWPTREVPPVSKVLSVALPVASQHVFSRKGSYKSSGSSHSSGTSFPQLTATSATAAAKALAVTTKARAAAGSPHDQPYNVVLNVAICGARRSVGEGGEEGRRLRAGGDRCCEAAHHCVHVCVGGSMVGCNIGPRFRCSSCVGGAD